MTTLPLGSLLEKLIDHRGRTPKKLGGDFSATGIPVISANNVKGGRLDLGEGLRYVSPDMYNRWMPEKLKPGDVLLTSEAPLGELAYLRHNAEFCLGQRLFALRTDANLLDSRFLYYVLSSDAGQHRLHSRATGTTAQGIRQSELVKVEVELPHLPEQRVIAHVLGTLDDKIELNRQMNQTLEQIAAALFRSWFIDFDPVRAKMAGREPEGMDAATATLFPERLVESELGEIPEGWEAGTLGDIGVAARKSINPARYPDQLFSHYSLPAFDAGRRPVTEPGGTIKSNKLVVPDDAVLVSKLNPHIPRVWLPAERSEHPRVASTEFVVLEPAVSRYLPFLYAVVSSGEFIARLQSMVTGTTGSHQRVPPNAIPATPLVVPTTEAISAFAAVAGPLYARGHAADRESVSLAALRDTLLPRLLSGELRVPTGEVAVPV